MPSKTLRERFAAQVMAHSFSDSAEFRDMSPDDALWCAKLILDPSSGRVFLARYQTCNRDAGDLLLKYGRWLSDQPRPAYG